MAIFGDSPGKLVPNVTTLDFTGAKDDRDGGDNWSYETCKAPAQSSPSTNHHTAFHRPNGLPVAQPAASKH